MKYRTLAVKISTLTAQQIKNKSVGTIKYDFIIKMSFYLFLLRHHDNYCSNNQHKNGSN